MGLWLLGAACTADPHPLDPLPPAPPRIRPDASIEDGGVLEAGVDPSACRPEPPPNPRLMAGPGDPLEACSAVAEAECVYEQRCAEAAPLPFIPDPPTGFGFLRVTTCRGQDPVANGCAQVAAAVRAGRLAIDPVGLAACMEGAVGACRPAIYSSGSRYDGRYSGPGFLGAEFRCDWLRPVQTEGEPCADDGECVSGRCSAACPGVCEAEAAVGSECASNRNCGAVGVCRERRCTPKKGIGEGCLPVFGEDQECQDGGYCDPSGICQVRVSAQGACERSHFDPCVPGHTCGPESRCVPLFGGDGEPCDAERLCASPLACRGGRCQALLSGGAQCSGGTRLDCDFGCTCRGAGPEGRCVPTRYRGEACASLADCDGSMVCRDGRCVDPPAEGEPCGLDLPCGHGRCSAGICQGQGEGQSCAPASDGLDGLHSPCAPGLLCRGPELICQDTGGCAF